MGSIKLADLLSSLVFSPGQKGNSFIKSIMIFSSQYLQVLVLILFTISTCQSSDISNEIVRQGVGSYGTELILEEMSQAPMSTSRDFTSPDFYGCGSCLSRLRIGDSGSLSSGAYDN